MAGPVALAIVLLVTVQVYECSADASRADVNDVRLDDLHERLESIQHVLDDRAANRKEKLKELTELKGRVRDLKDNECGARRFRCETRSKVCIHDMLVCDGGKDCPDGSDEADCVNPASAGTTLVGDTYNVKCMADAVPTKLRVDIIGEKQYSHFPSVIETTVQVTFTYGDGSTKTNRYNGVYSFGRKMLVTFPNEGAGLAMTCTFRTSTSEFCSAQFVSMVTKDVCGEAILTTA